jgi:uncharacterized protein YjbI with pentapeptide repeats
MTITQDALNEIVRLHKLWLIGDPAGKKADLSYSDLRGSNLSYSDLRGSDLSYSNLRGSDLRYSDLRGSDLHGSDLRYSNLHGSDLRGSNLSGSDLHGSDLSGSNLRGSANVVSVSGIGSSRRMTTYRADTDEIWCGCFKGTLAEFAAKIKETHKDNPEHLAHYRSAVAFFRAYKKSVKPVEKKQQRA